MKKILYIDMGNTLVCFKSSLQHYDKDFLSHYEGRYDEIDGIYSKMEPMEGAIESFFKLQCYYDTYLLSTAPWNNPSAWADKLIWVKKYLGEVSKKRLILSHNKHLNIGDFLIDDSIKNGAEQFTGELIRFGSNEFPNWYVVTSYLLNINHK